MSPYITMDPFNVPKFALVVITGFSFLAFLIARGKLIPIILGKFTFVVTLSFLFSLLLASLFSGDYFISQIYGDYGRNTGLFLYFALVIVFISSALLAEVEHLKLLSLALVCAGLINVFYGVLQYLRLDPINWEEKYNPIIGTLGNPNFASSFIAFTCILVTGFILQKQSFFKKGGLIFILLTGLTVIYLSDSLQGIIVYLISTYALHAFLYRSKFGSTKFKFSYFGIGLFGFLLGLFGIFNKGPFSYFLYQDSVSFRGDYWRTAFYMFITNPLNGVGLDRYGDFYRFYRDENSVLRRGPDVVADSAHNVFLDMAANGGLPLLVSYLLLNFLVLRAAYRIFRNAENYNPLIASFISIWIGYSAQSLVSINHIGLAIWGWAIGGAIIGFSRKLENELKLKNFKSNYRTNNLRISFGKVMVGFIVGSFLALPPLRQDFEFKRALDDRDVKKLMSVSVQFPHNSFYLIYLANTFNYSKIFDQARSFSELALMRNPREFKAWEILLEQPNLSAVIKIEIVKRMLDLDPNNQKLKVLLMDLRGMK